jgi:hypothetical protein
VEPASLAHPDHVPLAAGGDTAALAAKDSSLCIKRNLPGVTASKR